MQIQKRQEENEHSLEMHIPYVRKAFESRMGSQNDIKIVPLMVGQLEKESFREYAQELLPYFLDEKTLFVVSSDFCHWGKAFSFTHRFSDFEEEDTYKSIEKLDKQAIDIIESQNLEAFQQYLSETKNTICGRNPIQLLLAIIELAVKSLKIETKFVKYD